MPARRAAVPAWRRRTRAQARARSDGLRPTAGEAQAWPPSRRPRAARSLSWCSTTAASFAPVLSWLARSSCPFRLSSLGLLHEIRDAIELFVGQLRALAAKNRRDGA